MLRDHVARGTSLGQQAKALIERGELVPDELVSRMVEERISDADCEHGFVLDGFPRTLGQAKRLDEILRKKACRSPVVIHLIVDRGELLRRLSGRRTCAVGGEIYNIYDNPPRMPGRCDKHEGELLQRPDDREDVIAERMQVYDGLTRALIDYYRQQGLLVDVNGMTGPAVVTEQLQQAVASLREK
jgi:adenylate kinase